MTRPLATVVRVVAEVVAFTVLVLICAAPGLMWYTHDVSHMVVSLDGVWAFLTEHLIFSGVSLGAASYLYAVTAWEYKKDRPRNSVKARTQRPADFPPPYPNGWYLVQLSHNVARGKVVAVDALGQQFVVFRGHDDVVAILDAYCPHLGAHLGEGGTVTRNNCLRCPFHGWEFDANGKCRSIEGTTSIPTGSDIRKHASSEVNGGIFLWYHAGGVEPQWELDASAAISAGWHYRSGVVTSYVNTHIREIPENGSDSAHLNVLHKNFVVDWLQKTGLYHYWTATWAPHPTVKHKSSISLTQEMRMGVRVPMTLVKTVIEQRGPGAVSLQLFTPLGLVHAFEYITPVSSMQQRVVHVMYCSPHVPYMVGRFLLWALDKQFHRDQPIWERKRLVPRPVISKADGPIMEFRRWWSQFYSPESVDMATAIAKENMMDW